MVLFSFILPFQSFSFGNFCFCCFGVALALEGVGLGAEESGGFFALPGLGLADLAGLAGEVGGGADEVAVEHELSAAVVEPVTPATAAPEAQGPVRAAGDNPIAQGAKGHRVRGVG
jgi:hypothetical protein